MGILSGGGGATATDKYRLDVSANGMVANSSAAAAANVTALATILTLARTLNANVYFPAGTWWTAKYIDVFGQRGLKIWSDSGAVLRYPSDDPSVNADTIAVSRSEARSGFLFRYCTGCRVEGMTFLGGTNPDFITIDLGAGIYATHCRDMIVLNCKQNFGSSLYVQDVQGDTIGVGDSLTVTSGVVTLVDSAALFTPGHVGSRLQIAGATNRVNNGKFLIASYTSATTITFAAPDAIAETSSFRWSIADADTNTTIRNCLSDGVRGNMVVCGDSRITDSTFITPANKDECGLGGGAFALVSTTITFTTTSGANPVGKFIPSHHGKYVKITGATSTGNNGVFPITYISSTSISWTNASGVTEAFPLVGTWWIMNGDKAAVGAGAAALVQSGSQLTVTTATAIFGASDVNKNVRIAGATTANNNGLAAIVSVGGGGTTATLFNPAGVSEAFTGVVTVDSFDHGSDSSVNSNGSSHAIYLFAGRQNVTIDNCVFRGNRTCCVKVSGSTAPIRNIKVVNCTMIDCATAVLFGADDAMEHSGLLVADNAFIDCCTQREGWDTGTIIGILGSRNVTISGNSFHFTHNGIGSLNGSGVAGPAAISASQYVLGASQPVEDLAIVDNKFTSEPGQCTQASIFGSNTIELQSIGLKAKWNTNGSLGVVGAVVTLTDGQAIFSQEDVGKSITFVNCSNGGNNGTFTIATIPSKTTMTFVNGGSPVAGTMGGTYRIPPFPSKAGSSCIVRGNQIFAVGAIGINTQNCLGLEVVSNTFGELLGNFQSTGDCAPRFVGNREVGAQTTNARAHLYAGVSWPYYAENLTCDNAMGSFTHDFGVAISGSTPVDFPLLGKTGRVRPSDGKEEIVIAYGALPVDGDLIVVNATTLTYKALTPGAGQFNTYNDDTGTNVSLMTRINAIAGVTCADYGTGFSAGSVLTLHLRIRNAAATANTDGALSVRCSTLNPTFLVAGRNGSTTSHTDSRGSGSTGPVADKTVVWSPAATWTGPVSLVADNATARTLLAVGTLPSGLITLVAKASFTSGVTDNVVIGDGIVAPVKYYFDTVGSAGGTGVQVNISTDTTAAQCAARLRTAMLAAQPSLAVVDNANGTLTVTHNWSGLGGNVAMVENVTNVGFTVAGLTGGTVGGYVHLKNAGADAGTCDLVQHGKSAGTEEFRFSY